MWGALIALLLIVLGALLWADSLKARERAVRAGRSACERYQLQLLDTVCSRTCALRATKAGSSRSRAPTLSSSPTPATIAAMAPSSCWARRSPTCISNRTGCNERKLAHRHRNREPPLDRDALLPARAGRGTQLPGGAVRAHRARHRRSARGARLLLRQPAGRPGA